MKKLKTNSPELPKILVNKMLEKHEIDYDYVIANPEIDGVLWCTKCEWTREESDEYKKWFIEFFQKNVSPRYSKKFLEREWQWFNMMYGLKTKDE